MNKYKTDKINLYAKGSEGRSLVEKLSTPTKEKVPPPLPSIPSSFCGSPQPPS